MAKTASKSPRRAKRAASTSTSTSKPTSKPTSTSTTSRRRPVSRNSAGTAAAKALDPVTYRGAPIERRRSKLHGWGVFTRAPISKNTRIVAYSGEKITTRESLDREARYLDGGAIWCFKLNNRWVIDGHVNGNIARYVNHSCEPNCYTQIIDGIIWIRAARPIPAGAELTYNYHTDGDGHIQCRCRPGCTSML